MYAMYMTRGRAVW